MSRRDPYTPSSRCGMCGKHHPGRCDLDDLAARVAEEAATLRAQEKAGLAAETVELFAELVRPMPSPAPKQEELF